MLSIKIFQPAHSPALISFFLQEEKETSFFIEKNRNSKMAINILNRPIYSKSSN